MLQLQGSNNAALRTSEPAGPRVHRPCATLDAPNPSPEQVAQRRSLQDLCRRHPESFEAALAPGFEANYDRFFDSSGWADEAFVNYFGYNGGHGETFINTTEVLIESVHNSSSKPIIVVNFGDLPVPARWTAERFPQLVAFQARGNADFGFNFNKLRAMILAQVRTGIQVDSDTALIRDCEHFFRRTREEVTEAYPYPILPVHWASKDDDPAFLDRMPFACYAFKCPGCPTRTMRWAQAHPTWTFHALPFVGDLLVGAMDTPHRVLSLSVEASKPVIEDEDYFNVGLWSVGATKQWCKFEVQLLDGSPNVPFYKAMLDRDLAWTSAWTGDADPKWFPRGIPYVFNMFHGAKQRKTLTDMLAKQDVHANRTFPAGYFDGRFYETLEDMHGDLKRHESPVGCLV